MVIALLIFIGIPLWLIAIALLLVLRQRRRVAKRAGSFDAKIRATSGAVEGAGPKWSSGSAWWVSNVLVLAGGPARTRYTLLPVSRAMPEAIHPAQPDQVKRMGDAPVIVPFLLDPSGAVEVAVRSGNEYRALGPFMDRATAPQVNAAERSAPL
ncbi:MAG: hypothetical protein AB7R89_07020 [Dehalococcoidia bacterium]